MREHHAPIVWKADLKILVSKISHYSLSTDIAKQRRGRVYLPGKSCKNIITGTEYSVSVQYNPSRI